MLYCRVNASVHWLFRPNLAPGKPGSLVYPIKAERIQCIITHGNRDVMPMTPKVVYMHHSHKHFDANKLAGRKGSDLKSVAASVILTGLTLLTACDRSEESQQADPDQSSTATQSMPTELPPVVLDDLGAPVREESLMGDDALLGRGPVSTPAKTQREPYKKLPKSDYETIDWVDLMPKEDYEALSNPPAYITDVEEGSFEDQISDQMQNAIAAAKDDPYQQALKSDKVIPEMDGKAVRIPGFVVPLEFDDDQMIYQFFLVPFFGACIHVPPPPPNQIIFVDYPEGFRRRALFDPFWISGKLATSIVQNEVATSAYTMQMHYIEAYEEEYEEDSEGQ